MNLSSCKSHGEYTFLNNLLQKDKMKKSFGLQIAVSIEKAWNAGKWFTVEHIRSQAPGLDGC